MVAHRIVNGELIATPSVETVIRRQDFCDKLIPVSLLNRSLESESSLKRDRAFFPPDFNIFKDSTCLGNPR